LLLFLAQLESREKFSYDSFWNQKSPHEILDRG
jgi:hypothetical protein